jgi:hypothetical protein
MPEKVMVVSLGAIDYVSLSHTWHVVALGMSVDMGIF